MWLSVHTGFYFYFSFNPIDTCKLFLLSITSQLYKDWSQGEARLFWRSVLKKCRHDYIWKSRMWTQYIRYIFYILYFKFPFVQEQHLIIGICCYFVFIQNSCVSFVLFHVQNQFNLNSGERIVLSTATEGSKLFWRCNVQLYSIEWSATDVSSSYLP